MLSMSPRCNFAASSSPMLAHCGAGSKEVGQGQKKLGQGQKKLAQLLLTLPQLLLTLPKILSKMLQHSFELNFMVLRPLLDKLINLADSA